MEKVFKYVLIIVALLLINKFINVFDNVRNRELNLDTQRFELEKKNINSQLENYEMTVSEFKLGDMSIPIMVDKKSGKSYKFFINTNDKTSGWELLSFYERSLNEKVSKE